MNRGLAFSGQLRLTRPGAQFHCANQFQSRLSGRGERGVIAGEGIVIGDPKRFNPFAYCKADEVCGIGRAVGTVRVCMQIDQLRSGLLNRGRVHIVNAEASIVNIAENV